MDLSRLTRTLIVSDLDGTLLFPDGTLGDYTRDVLTRLIAKGAHFTVATGRSGPSAWSRLDGLELVLDGIVHNGALTVELSTHRISATRGLDAAATRVLYARARGHELCPMVYVLPPAMQVPVLCHGPAPNDASARYLEAVSAFHQLVPLSEFNAGLGLGLAAIILDTPERIAKYFAELTEELPDCIALSPGHSAYTPCLGVGEITSATAGKAPAALALAQRLGLTADDILAFGDNMNDLGLFQLAGAAFCPPGAPSAVRRLAAGEILSPREEGVARYLARVFLQEG